MLGGIRNPFLHQIVADPWDRVDSDVRSINGKAFDACVSLIQEVAASGRSTSLLMNGESGSGKTHLMTRLRKHIEGRDDAMFFAVRLETVAPRMWRHIRLSVVTDLLRKDSSGHSLLTRILMRRDPAESIGTLSYGLATVLDHYRAGRYQSWCIAWLKGEILPEAVLEKLELVIDETEETSLEEQAHQLVLELCRFASPTVAVFCFDQVEALETSPGDKEGLLAFGKAVTALHAELNNAVLISLIQTSFLPALEKGQSYILDRLSQHRAELHQLNREQAQALLLDRLSAADPELAAERQRHAEEPLWPVPQAKISDLFRDVPRCAARRLLHHAAQLFEEARGSVKAPDAARTLEEFLDIEYASRQEGVLTGASPAGSVDPDTILLGGLPPLLSLCGKRGQTAYDHDLIDFVIDTPGAPVAVCLVNQTHAGALARRLRKISVNWNAREFARLRLVRDSRLPLNPNATVTRDALNALRARGARLVRPSAEALAALEALRSLYADAQSGHLAFQGEMVPARSVLDWLTRRIPVALQELVGELVEATSEEAPFSSNLLEFLQKQSIVRLEDAADAIGVSAEEVAAYARSHPTRIGYLAGPPPVLFDPVTARARPPAEAN